MTTEVYEAVELAIDSFSDTELAPVVDSAVKAKLLERGAESPDVIEVLKQEGAKTEKVRFLSGLGEIFLERGDFDYALTLLSAAVDTGGAELESPDILRAYGFALYCNDKLDEAVEVLENLLEMKIEKEVEADAQHTLGLTLMDKGDFQTAHRHLKKSESLFNTLKKFDLAVEVTCDIGSCNEREGELEIALAEYERAMAYAKKYGLESEFPTISGLMGGAYFATGSYRSAATAFEQSLEDRSNPFDVYIRLALLGECYDTLKSHDKAETVFRELMKLADFLGSERHLIDAFEMVGGHYYTVKDYTKAQEYFRRAFNLREKYEEESGEEFPGSWEFCKSLENVNRMVEFQAANYADNIGVSPEPIYEIDEKMKMSMKHLIELLELGIDEPSAYTMKYSGLNLKDATNQFQKEYIMQILKKYRWEKTPSAKHLGVSTSNLYHYLYKLGIER